ncbi:MAG: hypothetical protein ACXWJB_12700 [Limisphaerales bacterium]
MAAGYDISFAASAASAAANSGTQATGAGGSIYKNTYTNSVPWQTAAIIGGCLLVALVFLFRRKE